MGKNEDFAKKFATMTADNDPRGSRHIFYSSSSVFVEHEGKILMIEEDKYDVPETAIDPPSTHTTWRDGTVISAAKRGVKKETGYDVDLTHLVGIYEVDVFQRHYYHFVFAGTLLTEEPEPTEDEHTKGVSWMTREEILAIKPRMRSEVLRIAFDDYVSGQRFPLEVIKNVGRTH